MIHVTVTSAIELTASQKTMVISAIEKKYSQKVELETVVDLTVLGGLSLTVGSQLYDSTLKTKIDTIKKALNQQLISNN